MKHGYVLIPGGSQAVISIEGEQTDVFEILLLDCPYCNNGHALGVLRRRQFYCFNCHKAGLIDPAS